MEILWLTITIIVYFSIVLITLVYYVTINLFRDKINDEYLHLLKEKPFVSIIVPTYNEETNIVKCVKSLKELTYPNFEIILSDGGSKDRTVELAKPYVDLIIIDKNVPKGWIGKNWGCHIAFKKAIGDILLFTDADTKHEPNSLNVTVSMLLQKKAGMLSLLPFQELKKWWESIIPIYFFLSNITSGGLRNVNDPRKRDSFVAIGQYLLFTKEAYVKIGGHEHIKGSIVEDYAFARVVKMKLGALYYMHRNQIVNVEMYPDSPQSCWYGFKKCLYAGTKLTPARRIFITVIYILSCIFSPIALILSAIYETTFIPIIISMLIYLGYILSFSTYWRRNGRYHWLTYIFFPFMMVIFLITIIASTIELLILKRTTWKGRVYSPDLKAGLNGKDLNEKDQHIVLPQLITDKEIEMNEELISTNQIIRSINVQPRKPSVLEISFSSKVNELPLREQHFNEKK